MLSLATLFTIAVTAWGPAPCGTPTVVMEDAPANVIAEAYQFQDYQSLPQDQWAQYCVIFVDFRLWNQGSDRGHCMTIVHEWGHVTGHYHERGDYYYPYHFNRCMRYRNYTLHACGKRHRYVCRRYDSTAFAGRYVRR